MSFELDQAQTELNRNVREACVQLARLNLRLRCLMTADQTDAVQIQAVRRCTQLINAALDLINGHPVRIDTIDRSIETGDNHLHIN